MDIVRVNHALFTDLATKKTAAAVAANAHLTLCMLIHVPKAYVAYFLSVSLRSSLLQFFRVCFILLLVGIITAKV